MLFCGVCGVKVLRYRSGGALHRAKCDEFELSGELKWISCRMRNPVCLICKHYNFKIKYVIL